MTIDEIVAEIEGDAFSIRLNLASGLAMFLDNVRQEPAVRELMQKGHDRIVVERVKAIATKNNDERYENPGDAALAVYCLILHWKASKLTRPAANYIRSVQRSWWARTVADRILAAERVSSTRGMSAQRPGRETRVRRLQSFRPGPVAAIFALDTSASPILARSRTRGGASCHLLLSFPSDRKTLRHGVSWAVRSPGWEEEVTS